MKTAKLRMAAACLLMFVMMLVSACSNAGTANHAATEAPAATDAAENTSGNNATAGDSAAFPRTVTSADGKEVTIAEQPKKIALVHWGLTQELLGFELPSIAVTLPFTAKNSFLDSDVYKPYVEKFDEVTVVGENTAVNLEALLQYEPDIILAGSVTNKDITDQLSQIAPTVLIDEEKTNVWMDWQGVITQFGDILGQETLAKQTIDDFSAKVEEAKTQLGDVEGTVAYLQVRDKNIWLQGTTYAGDYYEPLGLNAPEEAKGDGIELTLEGLSAINPDHIFLGYFNYNDKSLAALSDEWEQSEVWKKLKAVQQNQVYAINGELAYGYGPISKINGLAAIVDALK
ncbi:iron complex transport system substrate-binding protein [Paenibacillus endophyticus]|uniref:Iron complex transport system substrate-binding protein n=1 Tax=Paenibacillus endophyticus TaxID=1294268 RepID=A0A7W5CEL5_9BACL|nr:ABC transporter substrate-binding protein [Paenibacillus endophyticus]MBB3156202.1 iron complex transport system substrate-binding protein [Paenibacillus endophyticus]